jgi:hypothetical protein
MCHHKRDPVTPLRRQTHQSVAGAQQQTSLRPHVLNLSNHTLRNNDTMPQKSKPYCLNAAADGRAHPNTTLHGYQLLNTQLNWSVPATPTPTPTITAHLHAAEGSLHAWCQTLIPQMKHVFITLSTTTLSTAAVFAHVCFLHKEAFTLSR